MKNLSLHLMATLACLLAFAGGAVAQDSDGAAKRQPIIVAELGPQVGEQVPDFELRDQFGQPQNLESIMGPNGVMLLFHRSADW